MAEAQQRRSDREKLNDGCISTAQVARMADIVPATVHGYVKRRLLQPTRLASGTGSVQRYDLRDTTAVIAIARLRRANVPMRDVVDIQRQLREFGKDFASAQLVAVDRGLGRVDVVLVRTLADRKKLGLSLVENPGQTVIAELGLKQIESEARKAFAKALREPALIRGRKPKATPSRPQQREATG